MNEFNITFPGNKRVDVGYKSFTVKTDQNPENGGEGSAPEPLDLFLSSIGACAGIYAKTFCDVRKIPTDRMHLTLEPFLKEKQKLMDRLEMILYVNPAFPEKYFRAIANSMNGCSVKAQLHPDIKTNITVIHIKE
ncbi:MAG: OsmC family protein [Pseudomonadota bacterium]